MTKYTIVRHLLDAGHQIKVLYFEHPDYDAQQRKKDHQAVMDMGADYVDSIPPVLPVNGAVRRLVRGLRSRLLYTPEVLRPWFRQARAVQAAVERLRPEICLLYGFEPVEGFLTVRGVPKVAGLGVFRHNLIKTRLRFGMDGVSMPRLLLEKLLFPFWQRHYLRNARELIASLDGAWFFAENYARFCRERLGLKQVIYLPNPAGDEREELSSVTPRPRLQKSKFQVILVGHLAGTATRSGLKFFADKIYPVLEKRREAELYEFLIVGKFRPPEWLARRLQRPNIRLLGFVENFAETINRADVVLVPIPEDVGNRLRIVSAFSAEACVVTHASSCLGMPELMHGKNCLVGSSAESLAEHLGRACADRDLNRRLREGGRQTYELCFHPKVACRRIEEFLQRTLRDYLDRRESITPLIATGSDR